MAGPAGEFFSAGKSSCFAPRMYFTPEGAKDKPEHAGREKGRVVLQAEQGEDAAFAQPPMHGKSPRIVPGDHVQGVA